VTDVAESELLTWSSYSVHFIRRDRKRRNDWYLKLAPGELELYAIHLLRYRPRGCLVRILHELPRRRKRSKLLSDRPRKHAGAVRLRRKDLCRAL